jgi:hypothetical protein
MQNPASNEQRTARTEKFSPPKREKPRSLFLPNVRANNHSPLRAAQATKLLLDSTVVRINPAIPEEGESEKTVYEYNAAGQVILETNYRWDVATEQWKESDNTSYDDRGNIVLSQYFETEYRRKTEYAYDHLNWQTLSVYYNWEDGQWVGNGYKNITLYTDNAGSYTEERTTFYWENGAWKISDKEAYTYAGQRQMRSPNSSDEEQRNDDFPSLPTLGYPENLLTEARWHSYNDDGIWGYGNKTEFTRDANGRIIQIKYFDWNGNTWNEPSREKADNTYNAQGLLTAVNYYYWDYENNTWATQPSGSSYTIAYIMDGNNVASYTKTPFIHGNYEKAEYTYDAQGRAITAFQYYYYEQQWVKNSEYKRAFDNYGNVILFAQNSNWYNGAGQSQDTQEYAYDANGRQTMHSYIYTYNGEYNGYKNESIFDSNGNETQYIDYDYDAATQTFVPNYKSELTYGDILVNLGDFDNGYNPLTFKESRWENGAWVVEMDGEYRWLFDTANNPLSVEMWEKDGNQSTWYATLTYYYSEHEITTGIKTVSSNRLHVWISGAELKIENAEGGEKVQMFDISGKLMVSGQLSTDKSIRRPSLPAGVYFVKAGNQTAKFIKR